MKLTDLISISESEWLSGFKTSLEESGITKKSRLLDGLVAGLPDSEVLVNVFDSDSEKAKKSFNQTASSLYKEFLTYLLLHQRAYPETMMAQLRTALANANEPEFLRRSPIVERVFIDTENLDQLIVFYNLLRDHQFPNKYQLKNYNATVEKLSLAIDQFRELCSIETYFIANDLGRSGKKGGKDKLDISKHKAFYESMFGNEHPVKTQIKSRLFYLKTLKISSYFELISENSQVLSKEVFDMMRKRPYLYFNTPDVAEFSNISYVIYTSSSKLEPSEVNEMFNDFFENYDDELLWKLYPRVVQACITTQANYFGTKAGFRFIDDPTPMNPEIQKGLESLIPMVKKIRNRSNLTEGKERQYGLETEGFCRQHLPGENRLMAAKLFKEAIQEHKQIQHAVGTQVIQLNIIHCYFWAREWDKLLDEIEKYERLEKKMGQSSPTIRSIIAFNKLIGEVMLKDKDLSGQELIKRCKALFKGNENWYEKMVPYTLKHLKLS